MAVGREEGRGGEEEVESGERVLLAANDVSEVSGCEDTWPSDGGGSRHEVSAKARWRKRRGIAFESFWEFCDFGIVKKIKDKINNCVFSFIQHYHFLFFF